MIKLTNNNNNNNKYLHSSIPINTSLSSQSTDESSSSLSIRINLTNKIRSFQRMISFRNSSIFRASFDITNEHYEIIIHFLDDTERIFYIHRHCKGIDLLNEVYDYLNLSNEKKYFGLLIEDLTKDFSYHWLDSNKTLRKQFKTTNLSSYHLYFKVRFFVSNPSNDIDDEYIKYLYVLQIKKDLLSGKISCPRSTAAILASYIVQSELGDYDANEYQTGYLKDFRFVPFQNQDFEHQVQKYHKQHRGQSPADAEGNYLRIASTLDMYGVELHKTSVKVSNTNKSVYNSVVELNVGICAIGISIFQNSSKINTFSWDQISKLSFKRRTFYVEIIKNLNSSDNNSIVFTLRNYHACKYLWKSCVEHHTFFRLLSSSKNFQFPNQINEKKTKLFERVSSRRNIRSSTLPIPSTNKTSNLFHSSSINSLTKLDKSLPPPPKPPRQQYGINNIHVKDKPTNVVQQRIEYRNSIDMSNQNISKPFLIKLKPDIDGRYGFNIKNDDNRIIISKVVLNTPASRASLHEGDIIISINDINLKNQSQEQIINMIRNSEGLELKIKCMKKKNLLEESLEKIRHEISTNQLIEQYKKLSRRKEGFTFDVANQLKNFDFNRYKDILPYDQTRVILKTNPENDYINANYINVPIVSTDTVNRYIATQGPLPTTCEAFWRMIWEEKCTLMIMLTTLYENGRIKCHQYWPDVLEILEYESFRIRCCREKKENDLLYREFIFLNKHTNEERIIYQIQNEIWPDHGVPNDYISFINFVLEIRELRKANKFIPILVHCSAGIGRTGVLILMETALCLMETNQPVYPLDILRQMREQRLGMIQTISQYQFACEAILYAYDHGLIEMNET